MTKKAAETTPFCGIVMPLSPIDGCDADHWADVREIIDEAIETAGFEPRLVSDADDAGIIQKRIIQNLYEDPIVVCDVSGKNPNVMFELGIRLAFDKPTIVIKDDQTAYSFDTSPIEHLTYPRDLRFSKIVEFKRRLADKIIGTHKKACSDKDYTTFLKHFGEFTVAKIDEKEISGQEFIIEELRNLRQVVQRIQRPSRYPSRRIASDLDICLGRKNQHDPIEARRIALATDGVADAEIRELSDGHSHLSVYFQPEASIIEEDIRRVIRDGSRRTPLAPPPPLTS